MESTITPSPIFTIGDEESNTIVTPGGHDEESNSLLLSSPPDPSPPTTPSPSSILPQPPSVQQFLSRISGQSKMIVSKIKWTTNLKTASVLILVVLLTLIVTSVQINVANLQISANLLMHEEALAKQDAQFIKTRWMQEDALTKSQGMHEEALAMQTALAKKARISDFLLSLASVDYLYHYQQTNRSPTSNELQLLAYVVRSQDGVYFIRLKKEYEDARPKLTNGGTYSYLNDVEFLGKKSGRGGPIADEEKPFWYIVVGHLKGHVL